MQWLLDLYRNDPVTFWALASAALLFLDKLVAVSPWKWDDLILTTIKGVLRTIKNKGTVAVLLVVLMAGACATPVPGQEWEVNTYRTLATLGSTYDASMKSLARAYKEGWIDQAAWDKAEDAGEVFYSAYHLALDAMTAYNALQQADPDTETLAQKQAEVTAAKADAAGKLETFEGIASYLLEALDDNENLEVVL